jgi:hypothetical protein
LADRTKTEESKKEGKKGMKRRKQITEERAGETRKQGSKHQRTHHRFH